MKCLMTSYFIIGIVSLLILPLVVGSSEKTSKLCCDLQCEEPISRGWTIVEYTQKPPADSFLSYDKNSPIVIFSKHVAGHDYIWEGELADGRKGLVNRSNILESDILCAHPRQWVLHDIASPSDRSTAAEHTYKEADIFLSQLHRDVSESDEYQNIHHSDTMFEYSDMMYSNVAVIDDDESITDDTIVTESGRKIIKKGSSHSSDQSPPNNRPDSYHVNHRQLMTYNKESLSAIKGESSLIATFNLVTLFLQKNLSFLSGSITVVIILIIIMPAVGIGLYRNRNKRKIIDCSDLETVSDCQFLESIISSESVESVGINSDCVQLLELELFDARQKCGDLQQNFHDAKSSMTAMTIEKINLSLQLTSLKEKHTKVVDDLREELNQYSTKPLTNVQEENNSKLLGDLLHKNAVLEDKSMQNDYYIKQLQSALAQKECEIESLKEDFLNQEELASIEDNRMHIELFNLHQDRGRLGMELQEQESVLNQLLKNQSESSEEPDSAEETYCYEVRDDEMVEELAQIRELKGLIEEKFLKTNVIRAEKLLSRLLWTECRLNDAYNEIDCLVNILNDFHYQLRQRCRLPFGYGPPPVMNALPTKRILHLPSHVINTPPTHGILPLPRSLQLKGSKVPIPVSPQVRAAKAPIELTTISTPIIDSAPSVSTAASPITSSDTCISTPLSDTTIMVTPIIDSAPSTQTVSDNTITMGTTLIQETPTKSLTSPPPTYGFVPKPLRFANVPPSGMLRVISRPIAAPIQAHYTSPLSFQSILPLPNPVPIQQGLLPLPNPVPIQQGFLPLPNPVPVQQGLLPLPNPVPVQQGLLPLANPIPDQQGLLPLPNPVPIQQGLLPLPNPVPIQQGLLPLPNPVPVQQGLLPLPNPVPIQQGLLPLPNPVPVQQGLLPLPNPVPIQQGLLPLPNPVPVQQGLLPLPNPVPIQQGLLPLPNPVPIQQGLLPLPNPVPVQQGLLPLPNPVPIQQGLLPLANPIPDQQVRLPLPNPVPVQQGLLPLPNPVPIQQGLLPLANPIPDQQVRLPLPNPVPIQQGLLPLANPIHDQQGLLPLPNPVPVQQGLLPLPNPVPVQQGLLPLPSPFTSLPPAQGLLLPNRFRNAPQPLPNPVAATNNSQLSSSGFIPPPFAGCAAPKPLLYQPTDGYTRITSPIVMFDIY